MNGLKGAAFVTGASGFVGRNLVRALRAQGVEVRALARSAAAADTVRALGATPVMGDLDDGASLRAGMQGCTYAFHSAAQVTEWGPRSQYHRVNVEGTRRLLQAAREAGVRRFVHVSTEAVFCDGSKMKNMDESRPLPAVPLPRYPETKAAAERLVRDANGTKLETVIVRPRLIWGRDDSSVLPAVVEAVKTGRFRWIDGGRYLTSTAHIDNVCEGLLLAAIRGKPGEAYFVTDGAPVELRGFFTAMMATRGVNPGDKSVPRGVALALATVCEKLWDSLNLKGAPPLTRMAIHLIGGEVTVSDAKARRELGYLGKMSVEAGLAEMRERAARGA